MKEKIVVRKQAWVIVAPDQAASAPYSVEEAARLTGVHPDLLRHYHRRGLVPAAGGDAAGGPVFDDQGLYTARRIEHLRRRHGASLSSLPLLCGLLREVEELRAEVRFLRGA